MGGLEPRKGSAMKSSVFRLLLCCVVLSGCVSTAKYETEVEERKKMEGYNVALANRLAAAKQYGEDKQTELAAARKELTACQGESSALRDKNKVVQADKDRAEIALADTGRKLDACKGETDSLSKELTRTKNAADRETADLRAQLDARAKENADALRAAEGKNSDAVRDLENRFGADLRAAEKEKADLRALLETKDREKAEALLAAEAENTRKLGNFSADLAARDTQIADARRQLASVEAERDALARQKAEAEKEKAEKIDEMSKTYEGLLKNMKGELDKGNITISKLQGQLTVKMLNEILFASGSAEVKREGRQVLDSVAKALIEATDQAVVIEGHTDNVPISSSLSATYPSNWELSTARAVSVVRYLVEKGKMDPARISAAGFGENRPVVSNDTPEGRQKNRRIEIKLVPIPKPEAEEAAK